MPYCPKCDMEFVEGVTVCTDCGRPLFPSREEAMAAQKQEEEMAGELKSQALAAALTASEGNARETPRVHAYVKKSQKREDLKSSAAAFALVGAALAAASLVLWTGILNVSISGASRMIVQCMTTAMAVGCLLVAVRSFQSVKTVAAQVDEEEARTKDIIDWVSRTYTGETLDGELGAEREELSPEELSLKRFELIQDILVTNHDLPDPSYVDALSEEIYGKLYEEL